MRSSGRPCGRWCGGTTRPRRISCTGPRGRVKRARSWSASCSSGGFGRASKSSAVPPVTRLVTCSRAACSPPSPPKTCCAYTHRPSPWPIRLPSCSRRLATATRPAPTPCRPTWPTCRSSFPRWSPPAGCSTSGCGGDTSSTCSSTRRRRPRRPRRPSRWCSSTPRAAGASSWGGTPASSGRS
ncbi:hypothetical protein BU14_0065s0034 [Porphyra umbilicalis]|uniref:Uncharacterized protein n=1 Tax=Porphyra umbilicalis TaxID=2786 RepID=A0A1X6PGP2_PORUM|nr:hypothetical protein BU14_0065s0034 [Porphyra umbilicalis]|eukprot:OSX80029.1 hypothetical protein BU14_0065s0034 [Porphyra umbilicalis]